MRCQRLYAGLYLVTLWVISLGAVDVNRPHDLSLRDMIGKADLGGKDASKQPEQQVKNSGLEENRLQDRQLSDNDQQRKDNSLAAAPPVDGNVEAGNKGRILSGSRQGEAMDNLQKQRAEALRVAEENALQQQQQKEAGVGEQQNAIRMQVEQQSREGNNAADGSNNMLQPKVVGDPYTRYPVPTAIQGDVPSPRPVQAEGSRVKGEGAVGRVKMESIGNQNIQAGGVGSASNNNNDNNGNGNNQIGAFTTEGIRRGNIQQVEGNPNPVRVMNLPEPVPERGMGGMNLNWDWEDFSVMFDNYGAGEMKVRRAPHATTGEPWPLPQYYTKKEKNIFVVDPKFMFIINGNVTCDIIDQAVERYKQRIVEDALEDMYDNLQHAAGTRIEAPDAKYKTTAYRSAPVITKIALKVRKQCSSYPSLQDDESYDLVVKKTASYLWANEVWGLLRGLETLSQLIWRGSDGRLYMKESLISDYPRFPHRGILLDSSRHFIFKEVIFDMMDAMEMNKMNVLHWHIVDDQSFPYQSEAYPDLSAKGAFHPDFVYSFKDIADIIEYGRLRGIRIMPEFDTPGHTYSWGLSRPDLLTQCYSGTSPVRGYLGPINPARNSSYRFLKTLFGEILDVFKDGFIHLGGDEVPLGCWQSNPEVVSFGEKLSKLASERRNPQQSYFDSSSNNNIRLVYEHYVNRLMADITNIGSSRSNGVRFVMWQEVMNNDLKLPNDTLIQVWMGDMADVSRAISLGYDVLYSTCWYLDHMEYGVKWPKYYQCDPADTTFARSSNPFQRHRGYTINEKKVKGGEACLWAEYIDSENLISFTWPRASAVAERLWSSKETRNLDTAGGRLSEHRCRMLLRGLSVGQVSGPDYCQRRGVNRHRPAGCQGACQTGNVSGAKLENIAADCSWLLRLGNNITMLIAVAILAFVLVLALTRSNGRLYQLRICRNRTILLVFLGVLFVYFMCYTTIWMQAFEFSGSAFHRKQSTSS